MHSHQGKYILYYINHQSINPLTSINHLTSTSINDNMIQQVHGWMHLFMVQVGAWLMHLFMVQVEVQGLCMVDAWFKFIGTGLQWYIS
jgi:hypothetical protein